MTTAEYADGLRRIAAWYEEHPDAPIPHSHDIEVYHPDPDTLPTLIRALGGVSKEWNDTFVWLTRNFGAIKLKFFLYRDKVCTARVVGTKVIPAHTSPERTIDVVEWDCKPILGESQDMPQ